MIDALYNGRSGLKSYERSLNVDSNNIANVNTLAYKADRVNFEDMMYQNREGKGVTIGSINKSYKQGELKTTGNIYDMAIKGPGFFIVKDDNKPELIYTRAGNFRMGREGFLRSNELKVQGISPVEPEIFSSNPADKTFSGKFTKYIGSTEVQNDKQVMTINAKATDFEQSAKTDPITMSGKGYKEAGVKVGDVSMLLQKYSNLLRNYNQNPVEGKAPQTFKANIQYDLAGLTSVTDFVEITIDGKKIIQNFDTDAVTTMNKFVDQISNITGLKASIDETGNMTIDSLVPGARHEIGTTAITDAGFTVNIQSQGEEGEGLLYLNATRDALAAALKNAGADLIEIRNRMDLGDQGVEKLGAIQMNLKTLNLSQNPFGVPEIIDGVIYMKQGNTKFVIGKIETVDFMDKQSLNPIGGNLYSQSQGSGAPILNTKTAEILTGTLELSNADLSESLVNMMVNQRAFEANSKSLTTADEFLNIAIGLKK